MFVGSVIVFLLVQTGSAQASGVEVRGRKRQAAAARDGATMPAAAPISSRTVPYKINAVVIEPGMLVLTFRYARAFVQPRYLSVATSWRRAHTPKSGRPVGFHGRIRPSERLA
jgi:hypothetical protein